MQRPEVRDNVFCVFMVHAVNMHGRLYRAASVRPFTFFQDPKCLFVRITGKPRERRRHFRPI